MEIFCSLHKASTEVLRLPLVQNTVESFCHKNVHKNKNLIWKSENVFCPQNAIIW